MRSLAERRSRMALGENLHKLDERAFGPGRPTSSSTTTPSSMSVSRRPFGTGGVPQVDRLPGT
jgi:hypothetical protein